MDWGELEHDFRVSTQDTVAPYLFDRDDVLRWLKEAEEEAAIRGRLLHVADDPTVCIIKIDAGVSVYPLHPSLFELDHIGWVAEGSSRRERLALKSTEALDGIMPDWRDRTDLPRYLVQSETSVRLVPAPICSGELKLEGYRLPLRPDRSKPEIHQAHHSYLVYWALKRAYSVPDSETMDLGRAVDAERLFTRYFGERPDSDLRRLTREDTDHHNRAFFL